MAIIKCPECGRQISDKAPTCPNCGVEIAGKIVKCPQCGEVYFKDQEMCPSCHHLTRLEGAVGYADEKPVQQPVTPPTPPRQSAAPVTTPRPQGTGNGADNDGNAPVNGQPTADKPKHNNVGKLLVSVVIAALICGVCFYFYNRSNTSEEQEQYEYAMKSNDPLVLQSYLDAFKDAPEAHRDSIQAHLDALKMQDNDWTNALVSGSKTALLDYLSKHPNSEHKQEAMHKIDSLDWADASNENTIEAINGYLTEHANGDHVDEANTLLKKLKANTVQPEDKALVSSVMRHFFQAINSRDEASLMATCAPLLTNFLGKTNATKADVVTFMNKIYKEDITNMNWHLNNDYKIQKKEIGDEQYEYTVDFSAVMNLERTDATKETNPHFKIQTKINPDGEITALTMTKILE